MLLEKESKVLEKLKVLSVAVDYALKAGEFGTAICITEACTTALL